MANKDQTGKAQYQAGVVKTDKINEPTVIPDNIEIKVVVAAKNKRSKRGKAMDPVANAQVEKNKSFIRSRAKELGLQVVPPGTGAGQAKDWEKVQATNLKRDHFRLSIQRGSEVCYLVGFHLEHPDVEVISAEQATEEHIGYVRGEVDLSKTNIEPVLDAALKTIASTKKHAAPVAAQPAGATVQ